MSFEWPPRVLLSRMNLSSVKAFHLHSEPLLAIVSITVPSWKLNMAQRGTIAVIGKDVNDCVQVFPYSYEDISMARSWRYEKHFLATCRAQMWRFKWQLWCQVYQHCAVCNNNTRTKYNAQTSCTSLLLQPEIWRTCCPLLISCTNVLHPLPHLARCLPIHTYLSGFYPIYPLPNILSHIHTPWANCKNLLLPSFFPKLSRYFSLQNSAIAAFLLSLVGISLMWLSVLNVVSLVAI